MGGRRTIVAIPDVKKPCQKDYSGAKVNVGKRAAKRALHTHFKIARMQARLDIESYIKENNNG